MTDLMPDAAIQKPIQEQQNHPQVMWFTNRLGAFNKNEILCRGIFFFSGMFL